MDNERVLNYLATEIEKLRSDQAAFLALGRANDFAEYRHVCGVIRGLTHAETIVRDLVQRLEKNDD
jgi:hypothetical protein